MSRLRLDDGTSWLDPHDERLHEAARKAVHHREGLTREEAWLLADAVAGYCHLATHPAGTEAAIRKLRALRREAGKP